jgi:CubicO group peptidase (beta-lactamase class C family)
MKKSFIFYLLPFLFSLPASGRLQPVKPLKNPVERLEKDIPLLMKKADIPGMSIALIKKGKLIWNGVYGVVNADSRKPVTSETVFEAASLSKPVFAYGVLKLVDEGRLSLDTPLNRYLGNNYDVVDDPRINLITARHVLSHTSGFPNWRDNDGSKTLLIHFAPGSKFSYSGEGMVYLSRVVEKITGMSLEDYMQKSVLQPLGMNSSSYIWQENYDSLKAYRHDLIGKPSGRWQPEEGHTGSVMERGNAAASLSTNAVDYAKFLIALLKGTGLKKSTWKQMFIPQIRVDEKYPQIAWGLGVGLENMQEGEYIWHWGDNGDVKAYFTAFLPGKDAVVYFANSANGLSITREILADAIGGHHPALDHLNYAAYDAPSRIFLKSILDKGAPNAIVNYIDQRKRDSTQKIPETDMNQLGYYLLRIKKMDDAIQVFNQNCLDFPESWNVWDSLAEAYMDNGDKELAIRYYQKSLDLNPKNKNAEEQIKKLKS